MTAVRPFPAEVAPPPGGEGAPPRAEREGSVLWAVFTVPGSAWMIVFFLVPFYTVAAVAFGHIDPIFGTANPEWNPLQWDFTVARHARRDLQRSSAHRVPAHVPLRRPLARDLPRDRLPGRLLRLPAGTPHEGPAAPAPHPPVLGQLPVADAGVDRPAPARGLGERRARSASASSRRRTRGSAATRAWWSSGSPTATCRSSSSRSTPASTGSTSA